MGEGRVPEASTRKGKGYCSKEGESALRKGDSLSGENESQGGGDSIHLRNKKKQIGTRK